MTRFTPRTPFVAPNLNPKDSMLRTAPAFTPAASAGDPSKMVVKVISVPLPSARGSAASSQPTPATSPVATEYTASYIAGVRKRVYLSSTLLSISRIAS